MAAAYSDEPMPYQRLGDPRSDFSSAEAAAIGLDVDARPSFAKANRYALRDLAVLAART